MMPLGKEAGLGPGHTVLDGDPVETQLPTAAPPHFRPMPIVAKRSPVSATAELLYKRPRKNIKAFFIYVADDLELWWRRLDVEPRLRAMSLDDDGVVAGVSVLDVSHRETVTASTDSDVVK